MSMVMGSKPDLEFNISLYRLRSKTWNVVLFPQISFAGNSFFRPVNWAFVIKITLILSIISKFSVNSKIQLRYGTPASKLFANPLLTDSFMNRSAKANAELRSLLSIFSKMSAVRKSKTQSVYSLKRFGSLSN